MALPDGPSVYDRLGTMLYRVVTEEQYEQDLNKLPIAASSMPAGLAEANEDAEHKATGKTSSVVFTMNARYGVTTSMKRTPYSNGYANTAALTGAGNDEDGHAIDSQQLLRAQQGISVEQALERIFPACVFDPASTSEETKQEIKCLMNERNTIGAGRSESRSLLGDETRSVLTQMTVPSRLIKLHKDAESSSQVTGITGRTGVTGVMETMASRIRTRVPLFAENQHWLQAASTHKPSRLELIQLLRHLEERCINEHARPRGVLCPVREEIYKDGLKELMRQITLTCPERGLLLDKLTRYMATFTENYDILFNSACQYALRKTIERELQSHVFDEKRVLESEVRRLDNRVSELQAKYTGMMERFEEQKATTTQQHDAEVAYLKKANSQLIAEIKRIVALENATLSGGVMKKASISENEYETLSTSRLTLSLERAKTTPTR